MRGDVGAEEERLVRDFLAATEGASQDVDAMVALLDKDFVWQINVPLCGIVEGREAARALIEQQNRRSTGLLEGSELRSIASNDEGTVFTERVDVVEIAGKRVALRITGIHEVRDGKITHWREYFDSLDLAQQVNADPSILYEGIGA
jgi:limonene-1,2-epoxide hydrolase